MSAEVAIQKLSFPFSCAPRLSKLDEVTPEGCVEVKALQLHDLQKKPILSIPSPNLVIGALVHKDNQANESSVLPPEGNMAAAQVLVCAVASQNAGHSRRSTPEKLTVENEDQRPATKRQLSSESAARTISVVKKSAVRKEEGEQRHLKSKTHLGQKTTPCVAATGKRKRRKDLFTNSEVFCRVDEHALRTGAELKEKCVYDVKTIVQSITKGARNELERLRAIWVWLCHNIEYDVSGYLGRSEKLSSPEEVIAAGRGVCCGYSNLCTEMCREVGIECQEVPGHSKGIGYRQGQSLRNVKSDHLWNAVLLGGQWFLLDACWGAGRVDMEHESFVKRFDDFYFLTDPEEFIDSHFPDEEKWQLLDRPIPLEEFERRVFKTSAFFTMGLRLIEPHHFHIVTDGGEANMSLGFSRPSTFTYEITQHRDLLHCGASEQKDSSNSSFGLLTVSHRSMKLQLLPPVSGTYDVKVFARPESAITPLIWVCSFTVECQEPRAMEEIPENPFLSWGLQPVAASLGIVSSSLGSEVAEVEGGVFALALKTSRPLMGLCELVHPQLEAAVTKRCLATQIQPDALTCHILCPSHGFYRLSVFVRDYERTDAKFQNAANFLLHCKGKVTGQDELFPSCLGSVCGPGIRTLEAGLSKFSHTTALMSTQQGKCNLTFHNQRDLELHTVLSREENKTVGIPLSRHLFCTYTDTKVTVSVTLPDAGVYRLGLYARIAPGGDFNPMCDFVLRNSCDQPGLPFPCVYSAWRKGCVLFEPRVGLLEPLSWVRFRVRVPGAQRVSVVGETRTDLKMNKSRVWEGEVYSEAGVQQLKLAATSGDSSDMAVLMTFDIKQVERQV
ncbi:kyphoscoliosis peptidase [Echeneis naucrates]|uniref:Transglutaminase-like domain-containing protein n=1 Tax=Echeneis naucrates TaxID=173247 RepID=A0A665VA40_ECHNA|nr:kyphoscoliosis peptidase [Echeneis naucrates]